jgi:large subunit ribosomal protein L3
MTGILGKKIGMTSVFNEDGTAVCCTVIEAGPCYVTSIKTSENNGYESVQLGMTEIKGKRTAKAQKEDFRKKNLPVLKYLREFRDFNIGRDLKIGDQVKVDIFSEGEKVKVSGISKGKGFQGVVKRHGFGGGSVTHGQSDRLRAPGSIGASSFPSRVFKGQRMAGRTGGVKVSVRNLQVIKVIPDANLILVKGAVPGANNGLVELYKLN